MGAVKRKAAAAVALTSMVGGLVALTPGVAAAAVSPDAPVVINEVYGGGGNTNAPYNRDFVELFNKSDVPVDLSGWSIQYTSAAGSFTTANTNRTNLTGTIQPGEHYLVGQAMGAGTTLPSIGETDDSGEIAMSGTAGQVALVDVATSIACSSTTNDTATRCASHPHVVDFVGYGTAAGTGRYAGTGPAPTLSNSTSASRNSSSGNTADNAADFTAGAPTPTSGPAAEPPPPAGDVTIREVQGTGDATPFAGQVVTTRGVVTATYPTGGYRGIVIQEPGTGGPADLSPGAASPAVFVFLGASDFDLKVDDHVEVTGTAGEFSGLTQITADLADVVRLDELAEPVTPTTTASWPATAQQREKLESVLYTPTGAYTVTNTYNTNVFGEVGLAFGTSPLLQPTDVARPGSEGYAQQVADNAARAVTLDDGASVSFTSTGTTPPYISLAEPLRVGAPVTFTEPVVVDFRNGAWKFSPTGWVRPGEEGASFGNTREAAPDLEVTADGLVVGAFNVLNYFTTLGEDTATCTSYNDRQGNPVTVRGGCDQRGAFRAQDFQRQQAKIVTAINTTGADVLGLLEIENSARLGEPADEALGSLVKALNDAAGTTRWDYVRTSADITDSSGSDVITNAIIFDPARVEKVGAARALTRQASPAFRNAREPIGQAFAPVGGGEPFFLVANHFKSKGSGTGDNADQGDGQGASNPDRVAQATALRDWVPTVLPQGVEDAFLVGDFNSYSYEDPMQVFYGAGYTNVNLAVGGNREQSYSFGGQNGSLDHVVANDSAMARITGSDIWTINSPESVALEYSRYNSHETLFYAPDQYRSSDHDPVLVAITAGAAEPVGPVDITLLNINDFHGRIDGNTVRFAGTVEQLRKQYGEANTLFLSAGDNIGASLYASFSQQDQPTIDVLNAMDLAASAIGNHEFDGGRDDLEDRVIGGPGSENAEWPYLAANVYEAGTTTPAFDEYAILDVQGVKVGVIGAVTEETPALVSPSGIASLSFGDPVEAVNRVAAQLTDGDAANGEADVLIAEYHEGAGFGVVEGSTIEEEVADGGVFADIVEKTSAEVAAIFTGHTHKQYAWEYDVPGRPGTKRPILQTGSYGEFIGRITLTVDPVTGEVVRFTQNNQPRTTAANDALIAEFPRVKEVDRITRAAIAKANEIGNVRVATIARDITTAYTNGSYVNGRYTGGTRDDRASESTLSNLIANAFREMLSPEQRGGAEIGVQNPGGVRAELLYGAGTPGEVTVQEAVAVTPFANDLFTTTLTGAQFKTLLEQQWQRDANGNVPSRPFQHLGLSDNVSYTFDPTRAEGDRITSITVDGAPIDMARGYRVGTVSFLMAGGDNFRVFKEGRETRGSGYVDRDAWTTYLAEQSRTSAIMPSFARRSVQVAGLPTGPVRPGDVFTLQLAKLDLTSQGSPRNTSVAATVGGEDAGRAAVTDGAATLQVRVPDVVPGATTLVVTAAPSGTTVQVPLTVEKAPTPEADRDDLLATVGTDRQVWTRSGTSPTWTPRGGVVLDAPAVVRGSADTYLVGLGADRNVWVRGLQTSWQRLGPVGTHCTGPSAVGSGGQLAVACRGADGALYTGQVTLPTRVGAVPQLTAWVNRGGRLLHGAAVSAAGSGEASFVYSGVGTDSRPWSRTSTAGWSPLGSQQCGGPLAASEVSGVWACRDRATDALTSFRATGPTSVLGGRTTGRPGISVDPDGVARFAAIGADGRVWVVRQSADGTAGGFSPVGGDARHGVSMLNLTTAR